jgi:hypothetical protein
MVHLQATMLIEPPTAPSAYSADGSESTPVAKRILVKITATLNQPT